MRRGTRSTGWGVTYWSHGLSEGEELWVADGNTIHQYDLGGRRYQADMTTELSHGKRRIVRAYASRRQS